MAVVSLSVVDWNRSRRAELSEVPADSTVGELLSDVREAMSLPRETPYHLIYGGQKLHRTLTLEEAGGGGGGEEMRLRGETPYNLIYWGQKLHRTLTLEEAGLDEGEEVTIAPEVTAG